MRNEKACEPAIRRNANQLQIPSSRAAQPQERGQIFAVLLKASKKQSTPFADGSFKLSSEAASSDKKCSCIAQPRGNQTETEANRPVKSTSDILRQCVGCCTKLSLVPTINYNRNTTSAHKTNTYLCSSSEARRRVRDVDHGGAAQGDGRPGPGVDKHVPWIGRVPLPGFAARVGEVAREADSAKTRRSVPRRRVPEVT